MILTDHILTTLSGASHTGYEDVISGTGPEARRMPNRRWKGSLSKTLPCLSEIYPPARLTDARWESMFLSGHSWGNETPHPPALQAGRLRTQFHPSALSVLKSVNGCLV
jgi:hypothetical protein